jgi:hypothetical protein
MTKKDVKDLFPINSYYIIIRGRKSSGAEPLDDETTEYAECSERSACGEHSMWNKTTEYAEYTERAPAASTACDFPLSTASVGERAPRSHAVLGVRRVDSEGPQRNNSLGRRVSAANNFEL